MRKKLTNEEVKTHILERLDGTDFELIEFDYKGSHDCNLTVKCKECGAIKEYKKIICIKNPTCPMCEYNKRKQYVIENITKCKTLKEFRTKYHSDYKWLKKHNLLEEMTNHLERRHGNIERLIYVYEIYIEGMKPHAYVGLTYNLEKRDEQHLHGGETDSLWRFCKEYNVPMPKPKILMDYVPEDKASRMEAFYEKQYRERGFETINVKKCGSLGAGKSHTFEDIEAIGKKYSSRWEWERNECGSYRYAHKHYKNVNGKNVKWIDLIMPETNRKSVFAYNPKNKKPVIAMNIKTKETRIYESINDARKDGFDNRNIWNICNGKRAAHKGWIFRYIIDGEIKNIERAITDRRKPIIGYNPKTKETRIYESIKATKKDSFNSGAVCNVCRGKVKSHKGWTFRYIKDGEIENVA